MPQAHGVPGLAFTRSSAANQYRCSLNLFERYDTISHEMLFDVPKTTAVLLLQKPEIPQQQLAFD